MLQRSVPDQDFAPTFFISISFRHDTQMKSYSLTSLFDFRFSVSQNEYLLELIFRCSANGSNTERGDNQSAKLIYLCSMALKT